MTTHSQARQAGLNPNQVNTSILGMTSAVFTSVAGAIVTTAVKSNVLIDKSFNVAIHGVAAAEHIAEAGEQRAKIYGEGIVRNGALSEREQTLKHQLRLLALEEQEKNARAFGASQPSKATSNQTRTTRVIRKKRGKKKASKKAASKK